ncbi:MAG: acylphosphatase [Candidatus Thermoplasmatota archaeon]|nr:acylphosphatase [Candidatus Thermoplasmatota archaeon]
MVQVRVKFYGIVQGVFFRANIKRKAREMGINGYVRNMPDGSVEAVFEGDEKKVKEIIDWCSTKIHMARVTNVDVKYENIEEFSDFEIR